jgi:hypothetical protein
MVRKRGSFSEFLGDVIDEGEATRVFRESAVD